MGSTTGSLAPATPITYLIEISEEQRGIIETCIGTELAFLQGHPEEFNAEKVQEIEDLLAMTKDLPEVEKAHREIHGEPKGVVGLHVNQLIHGFCL